MAERRGVKREFAEMPLAYDPEEIMRYMKALVCDQPKILVDLGGIPDELGIEDCISLGVPSPTLKVPRHLQDPTEYYKALHMVLEKSLERDNYKNLIERCYDQMFGPSCSFNQELVTTRHFLEAVGNKLEQKPAANLVHPHQEARGVQCNYAQWPFDEFHGYTLHEFVFYMKALMRDQPAILDLLAGIPDKLQIKDCLSYRVPSPTIKVPGRGLHNPTEYYKALRGVLEKSLAEYDLESKVDQKAAFGISLELHNMAPIHDLLQVIGKQLGEVPANLDASLASLHINPRMKQSATDGTERCKYAKYSYKDPCNNAPIEILRREFGVDTVEIIYSKGVLVNEPGVVFAIGGIPEELKIKGAKSFSFPCPIFKFPRTMPVDPTLRGKIMAIAYNGAVERFGSRKLFLQAYKEAMGVSLIPEPPKEEKVRFCTHNVHYVPCPIIEVNLAGPLKKIPRQLWWMFINGAGQADPSPYLLMEPINGAGRGEVESYYNLSSCGSLLMVPINRSWARRTET